MNRIGPSATIAAGLVRSSRSKGKKMGLNKQYGLPDELRLAALKTAEDVGVKEAAKIHNVSGPSIYRWRKIIEGEKKE